jgi:putative MATE family efflux protein
MAEATREIPSELGTKDIGRLLRQYALPAIIAQVAASLYNMVDSIYIGHISESAISGLAATFPLMNLSVAFGTLVGAGAATMISILLGQKHYHMGNKVLGNVVSLNMIIGLVFMIISVSHIDPILTLFGANYSPDPELDTLTPARDYATIVLYGNVITHLYFGLNAAMRSSGSPRKAMGLTIFTVIINAILDPIFIFGFKMGIAGAAWATVIAQFMAMLVVMHHFSNKSRAIHFEKGIFRLNWNVAKKSLIIGTGPFLMNLAACIVTLFINQQLRKYGYEIGGEGTANNYVGAYGICNRIIFMFIMICMGLNQGMQPIAGYNYGAKLYSRVKEVFWKTAKLGMLVTTICFIIGMFFPRIVCGIFINTADGSTQMLDIAERGLRLFTIMFPIVGLQMIGTNFFQSLGLVKKSIILSLSRQLLMLLPALYLLPMWIGTDGVWLSFPVSDFLSTILTVILLRRLFNKFNRLHDGDSANILDGQI